MDLQAERDLLARRMEELERQARALEIGDPHKRNVVEFNTESPYARELRKWDKPYVYQEFPMMLYRAGDRGDGIIALAEKGSSEPVTARFSLIVHDATQYERAVRDGWKETPKEALEAAHKLHEELGQAAAERNYRDRNMGEEAKAESAVAEAAHEGHLAEIPEKPRRGRPKGSKNKPRETAA